MITYFQNNKLWQKALKEINAAHSIVLKVGNQVKVTSLHLRQKQSNFPVQCYFYFQFWRQATLDIITKYRVQLQSIHQMLALLSNNVQHSLPSKLKFEIASDCKLDSCCRTCKAKFILIHWFQNKRQCCSHSFQCLLPKFDNSKRIRSQIALLLSVMWTALYRKE